MIIIVPGGGGSQGRTGEAEVLFPSSAAAALQGRMMMTRFERLEGGRVVDFVKRGDGERFTAPVTTVPGTRTGPRHFRTLGFEATGGDHTCTRFAQFITTDDPDRT
jgi:hypothetical protein